MLPMNPGVTYRLVKGFFSASFTTYLYISCGLLETYFDGKTSCGAMSAVGEIETPVYHRYSLGDMSDGKSDRRGEEQIEMVSEDGVAVWTTSGSHLPACF